MPPEIEQQLIPIALPPLSDERKRDLRNFVLAGGRLDKELSRQIVENMRRGRSAMAEAAATKAANKSATKRKTAATSKKALSDDELDADFAALAGGTTAPQSAGDASTEQ